MPPEAWREADGADTGTGALVAGGGAPSGGNGRVAEACSDAEAEDAEDGAVIDWLDFEGVLVAAPSFVSLSIPLPAVVDGKTDPNGVVSAKEDLFRSGDEELAIGAVGLLPVGVCNSSLDPAAPRLSGEGERGLTGSDVADGAEPGETPVIGVNGAVGIGVRGETSLGAKGW
jgi:hypothetical protein